MTAVRRASGPAPGACRHAFLFPRPDGGDLIGTRIGDDEHAHLAIVRRDAAGKVISGVRLSMAELAPLASECRRLFALCFGADQLPALASPAAKGRPR